MTKTATLSNKKFLVTLSIAAITSILLFSAISSQKTAEASGEPLPPTCTGERVSVTVPLDQNIKPGEVMVLLDTTGSGKLCVVHVAANLPCGNGPTDGAGNDVPEVNIVAGVAGGDLSPVIESGTDDTGFAGPSNTCVFHDTLFADGLDHDITDVILGNFDKKPSNLNGAVVTITGTYADGGDSGGDRFPN